MSMLKKIWIVSALMILTASTLLAEVKIKIRRIYVDDNVYTPYYDAETEQDNESGAAQRWLRLTVEYSTSGGWFDELTIKQLALVGNHGSPAPVVLSKKVTYMNVGPGNHVSYVYMHPNCVKRYECKAKYVDSAAEFSINGKVVAYEETSKHNDKGWGNNPDLKFQEGHLLSDSETPFWFINYDFKEITKQVSH